MKDTKDKKDKKDKSQKETKKIYGTDAVYSLNDILEFTKDYVFLIDGIKYDKESDIYKEYKKLKKKEKNSSRINRIITILFYVTSFLFLYTAIFEPKLKRNTTVQPITIAASELYKINYKDCTLHGDSCSEYVVVADNEYYIFNNYNKLESKYTYEADKLKIEVGDQTNMKPLISIEKSIYESNINLDITPSYELTKISIPDGFVIPYKNVYGDKHISD